MMEMEALDKLYLEISQFTKAKTKADLDNEGSIKEHAKFKKKAVFLLKQCNDALFNRNHVHTVNELRNIKSQLDMLIYDDT